MGNKPLVLVVEDDEEMARLNARFLRHSGYDAVIAHSAKEALAFAASHAPDLLVLDIQLPDGDGLSICEEIRRSGATPVVFLTGRKEPGDKAAGLDAGGDYYLTKPFAMEELIAVVQRLLHREAQTRARIEQAVQEASTITRGALTLHIAHNKATVNGRDAGLSPKEFAILLMLVQQEGKVLTAEAIYESVWGAPMAGDSGTIRQHISRMKKKLGEETKGDFAILNDYGGSYTFIMK